MFRTTGAKAFYVEMFIKYALTEKHLTAKATQLAAPVIAAICNNVFDDLNNNKRLSVLIESLVARPRYSAWLKERTSCGKQAS